MGTFNSNGRPVKCSWDDFYATPYPFQHTQTLRPSHCFFLFLHFCLRPLDSSTLHNRPITADWCLHSAALLPFLSDCLLRCFCTDPKIASLGCVWRVHTTSCPVVSHRMWRTAQKNMPLNASLPLIHTQTHTTPHTMKMKLVISYQSPATKGQGTRKLDWSWNIYSFNIEYYIFNDSSSYYSGLCCEGGSQ